MTGRTTLTRQIVWSASGSIAVAASVMMTASVASAATPPDNFYISATGIVGTPSVFYVGDTYGLGVESFVAGYPKTLLTDLGSSKRDATVAFTDNGSCIGTADVAINLGIGSMNWIPTTTGQHTLTATVDSDKQTETMTITVLPPAGGTTPPPAQPNNCATGSGSSGS
ncbi:hypothetical protein [Nocardia sp.]|uniref:hypothetical protein n=1 Tax=Nocardia sp. TaxID=1821 RepID=UPI002609701A|nr:hypothetical protein [Nocardia sp.]